MVAAMGRSFNGVLTRSWSRGAVVNVNMEYGITIICLYRFGFVQSVIESPWEFIDGPWGRVRAGKGALTAASSLVPNTHVFRDGSAGG